jgi:branched-chain amino acid transport system permease protein
MITRNADPGAILLAAVIALLFGLQFAVSDYHHLSLARIMVLATYAAGYNLLFGYTGLLSLGHAMFFAAGLLGAGLASRDLAFAPPSAFLAGVVAGLALSMLVGLVALRTTGVFFMIVCMMFAQAFFLLTLLLNDVTGGDQGFVISETARRFLVADATVDLTDAATRYNVSLTVLAIALVICLMIVRSRFGRVLAAIRENEERATMLGFNTYLYKLAALVASGTIAAAAGASYVLLFAYAGSTFASVQYSILPLLWVLLGGARTVLGPLVGTLLMFYLVDIASGQTSSHLMVVGLALIVLVLWFPRGIMGWLREKAIPWLP